MMQHGKHSKVTANESMRIIFRKTVVSRFHHALINTRIKRLKRIKLRLKRVKQSVKETDWYQFESLKNNQSFLHWSVGRSASITCVIAPELQSKQRKLLVI